MELSYYSVFPYATNPVFSRGGGHNNNIIAGLFYFGNPSGETSDNHSFRPVLATL